MLPTLTLYHTGLSPSLQRPHSTFPHHEDHCQLQACTSGRGSVDRRTKPDGSHSAMQSKISFTNHIRIEINPFRCRDDHIDPKYNGNVPQIRKSVHELKGKPAENRIIKNDKFICVCSNFNWGNGSQKDSLNNYLVLINCRKQNLCTCIYISKRFSRNKYI